MALDTYVPGMCINSTTVYIIIIRTARPSAWKKGDVMTTNWNLTCYLHCEYRQTNEEHIAAAFNVTLSKFFPGFL